MSDSSKNNKEKDRKTNEKNSKRAEAVKNPKSSPLKWFREARAEFKKVTWPTPKQTMKNTNTVLIMLVVAGIALWGLDWLLGEGFKLILGVK